MNIHPSRTQAPAQAAFLAVTVVMGILLGALAGAQTQRYSEEVFLWPKGSRVLTDGARAIRADKEATAKPELVVTNPSFLAYLPASKKRTPAVLVFPGGGFKALAIGKESTLGPDGADVAHWLNQQGIACFVIKYRVPNTACNWNEEAGCHVSPKVPLALQDTQRAVCLIRSQAEKYNLDPHKIGVMGFSAGGYLAVLAGTAFEQRSYAPVDAADKMSCRPDFAIPVYPGHMTMEHKNKIPKSEAAKELSTDIKVSKNVPPTLLVHAKDDPTDPVHYSMVYARELKRVGAPVQMNLYSTGGHAFGVRKAGKDTDRWQSDALAWLKKLGVI